MSGSSIQVHNQIGFCGPVACSAHLFYYPGESANRREGAPEKEVTLLRFDHVSLSYGAQKILSDISFEVQEGQFAVFIGPSGCGKTTTLKMINRLIQPDSGHIY